jgi:AraC family transcriptional regulator
MIPSLEASKHLHASLEACSWTAGWRSLLLRQYLDSPNQEQFTTAATPDHLFVLVTGGSCHIESFTGGAWRTADYRVGSLAMCPPGASSTLRWRSHEPHRTLQLHLPREILTRQSQELWDRDVSSAELPVLLTTHDPLIESTMLALSEGLGAGLPDLYAQTSAEFLSAHLLLRHCKLGSVRGPVRDDQRLRQVDTYMRDNLSNPVSLEELAQQARLSRFHLLRLFKRAYGETPLKRLTRLRMDEAKRYLQRGGLSISEIANRCGYENPAHFASAFRRVAGVAPTAYRTPTTQDPDPEPV